VQDVPFRADEKRLTVKKLGKGFYPVECISDSPGAGRAGGLEGARVYGLSTIWIPRRSLFAARRW